MPRQAESSAFGLLKRLTETPGVPGREERVRELILAESGDLWDETTVDPLGNLICLKRAARPSRASSGRARAASDRRRRVMLACHMDEIGFYVRHIDENGFLRLQNVGGFDTRNLFARRVIVHGRQDLLGVLNPIGKPVHLASEEEKKKVPQMHEFCVDLFRPRREVMKLVEVGDPVTLAQTTEMIGPAICGKAMDNRVALCVAIEAVRRLYGQSGNGRRHSSRGRGSPYDIYFVACAQEEVGLRGATTAAYGIEPDIGICIDVTLCCDTPGVSKDDAVTEFGKGVAIKVMDSASISDRGLFDEFVALARRCKIAHQREVLPRGGTDAGAVQRSRSGTRTITLSVPTRYVHTVTEAVHIKDLMATVELLVRWLAGGR